VLVICNLKPRKVRFYDFLIFWFFDFLIF
jgi:hypothetical protein